ncbi:uncharacterized protein I303_105097 [Kwoniella dejecticola CBS 10117]|uniref:Peroxin-19 n=1 Tax=Kwoniella dejecticola CBS 10117 TaxID=1296121 RepID=A0A1A6A3H0_9TREE|nr:uncharacterized protein I303_05458 [Kwoniella dejecticola CBS 10117]OBR84599.1 hypothetical protein I303_05458 [Kwoniella dejecticola CBS 10117]
MPPPEQAESSKSYRSTVEPEEVDDDDDLDDLDDVLASFNTSNKPSTSSSQLTQPPPELPHPSTNSTSNAETQDDEAFEASLMEGMDALLKQLAGDHPPGPMLGKSPNDPGIGKGKSPSENGNGIGNGAGAMSKEAEEEAWQKALEMVLSGEGLKAMGLDGPPDDSISPQAGSSSSGADRGIRPDLASNDKAKAREGSDTKTKTNTKPTYEETLAKTLESLNAAGSKPNLNTSSTGTGPQPDLSSLLASLGGDPDLLKDLNGLGGLGGEGEDGSEGDLADVLEGMMRQLMNKEVLEEPMNELASKYPPYLASPPAGTSKEDLEKYRQQNTIVQKIVSTFRKPGYTDERDGKEIAGLVGEMQDLGGPPKEIMGDLPEGFDLGALGGLANEDGCTIM